MCNNYFHKDNSTLLNYLHNSFIKRFLILFTLFISNYSLSQSPFVDNTPNGNETFIVPSGVTSITVSVWGAGGGGGGSSVSGDGGSGGGGGGATTRTITVTPGDTFTYNVGAGGAGGLANATLAGNGANTTFVNGGLGINMIGNGGSGGARNRGAAGTGGNASGGTTNMPGQNGTIGDTSGQAGGNSGAVVGIFGAGGASVTNATGNNGIIPGGGGGGAERPGGGTRNGGNGANGQVRITFTCPSVTVNAGVDQTLAACATTATLTGSAIPVGMTGTWTVVTGPGSITSPNTASTGVTGLVPGTNTTFRWTISNGTCGTFSDDILITTVVGGGCTPYCVNTYTTAVHPITNVSFSDILNSTSNVVNGTPAHEFFYTPVGQVERGELYQLSVSGNTNGATAHGIRAFFDWNADGDFLDAGESINVGTIDNVTIQAGIYVQIPLTATVGQTRMRITLLSGAYATSCRTGAGSGQSEDYIINITTQTCNSPTAGFSFTGITGTTATINWTNVAPAPAGGYDIYISPINLAPNTIAPNVTAPTANDAGSPFLATGLTPGVRYYVWIRSNCTGGDYGVWNSMGNFITTLTNENCLGAINVPVNAGTDCNVAVEGDLTNSTGTSTICTITNSYDVWYSFTATSVTHRITVVPQPIINYTAMTYSTVNLNFQVISGTCALPVSLACVNNNTTNTETTSVSGLIPGNTYFIRVFGTAASRTKFTVCVTTGNATHSSNSAAIGTYTIHPNAGFSDRYIEDYNTTGTLTNTINMGTGRSITGYKNYTALTAAQGVAGGGINVDIALRRSRQVLKAWVDWNNDGLFNDATETVYDSNGILSIATSFGFVIPGATPIGNYRLRVRASNFDITYNSYTANTTSASLLPYGFTLDGETEDYMINVVQDCVHQITSVTDGSRCDVGTVNLSVTTSGAPTHIRWYDAEVGGTLIGTSAVVANSSTWTTPSLTTTTTYWATAYNTVGGCETLFRKKVIATINPIANMFITPSTPEICGENNIISITAAGDTVIDYLVNENFNTNLGALTPVIIGGAGDALTTWQREVSPFVPPGSVWKPAIISRSAGDGFAMATSDYNLDVNVALESAILDSSPYTDLTLTFRHYYSYYGVPYDIGYVEVSTDGGTTYTDIMRITSDQGQAGNFNAVTINMNAYINQTNLKVRFRYNAKFCDGWAIDDVQLFGTRPLSTSFTWSGAPVDVFIDPACTIPYVAQLVPTVYVRPSAMQIASSSWSFTATATLNNGCSVSIPITIDNKSKLWKGTVSTDWNNPNNWSPVGVPDSNTCVIIYDGPNDARIIGAFYNAFAKYVIVRPNGDLLVNTNNTLTITDNLTVEPAGVATFENSSSLIQVNSTPNVGNITMKRDVNIRKLDYVYWGSPVAGFSSSAISPGTNSYFIFKWNPTIGANVNGFGNWIAGNESMVTGKGYIVRGPDAYTTTLQNYTANFVGVPNNGNITTPISRGTYDGANYATGVSTTQGTRDDDNWNLLSNPYPSALNANIFLATNTNIAGYIKRWTHGTLPSAVISDPFYADYVLNYTVADYVTYNATGANPPIGDGNIAAGQGFFVLMNHTSAATTENVIFNNSMRRNDYRNDMFYKNSNANSHNIAQNNEEKHRIWVNLISPTNSATSTLVGYVTNATNENDRLYDAQALDVKTNFELYSINQDDKFTIQGRALPFNENDLVPLGLTIPEKGLYKIALTNLDGLFSSESQNIYLEDHLLNSVIDLRSAPYTFISDSGSFINRFTLRFTPKEKVNTTTTSNTDLNIYANDYINITSKNAKVKDVKVYDLLGKLIYSSEAIHKNETTLYNLRKTNTVVIVNVTLDNNNEVSKKVTF